MNQVIKLLKQHCSIRQFTEQAVSDEMLSSIIEAASCAATSNFIQAYTVIRVNDTETRKQIATLAGPQAWVEKAPVFLVLCADLKKAELACAYENKEMQSGFVEQFIVSTVDVSLFAQNAMIAAESLGLGGVFIGGIRNNPEKVCELLEIPENVYPIFGMCLGFPAIDQERKPRLPVDVILKQDKYHVDQADLIKHNKTCHDYYKTRSSGARDETWTAQIAKMMSTPLRTHMKAFLEKKGFTFK
jgi:nitroreductase